MKIAFISLLSIACYAAGPAKVATFDRTLWPDSIHSKASFDMASRHEIIKYVSIINNTDLSSTTAVKDLTGLNSVNLPSVSKWTAFTKNNLLKNFNQAQGTCSNKSDLCAPVKSWIDLVKLSSQYKPTPALTEWSQASNKFFSYYLYEQVRLAALFPRVTSEIDTLDDSEEQGFNLPDGKFLLTFDDGPKYSNTKAVVDQLKYLHINGLFFVLGENLENSFRINGFDKISSLYDGMCVGSHGYIHKSHPKLANWSELYDHTRTLITNHDLQGTHKNKIWFRPPYGERQQELVDRLGNIGDRVMLWNIDSQDWNNKLSVQQVEDRTITLMLVQRKGIILFHDIHSKAVDVVTELGSLQKDQAITIVDCGKI
jgi:peptidoglycan/xylan/chitin deacetylase (PgdA/CDA1 family)